MLFLIATPIGNLADITFRAVETLKSVDYILCEDTRRSSILLKSYAIKKPLKSFHKFNEKKWEDTVVSDLKKGNNIALISDAGTPVISDPGQRLVARCHAERLSVTSLPGPSAPIVALSLAGFETDCFQFIGFLSKKAGELKKQLLSALFYPGITVCFESPSRVKKTLELINSLGPAHPIVIARELTKIHEECLRGVAKDFLNKEIRGEVVLIIEGKENVPFDLSPKEHVLWLQKTFDLDKQDAIKIAASLRGVSKKQIYF